MSRPQLIANWKMNLPPEGIAEFLSAVGREGWKGMDVIIAPPFPFLAETSAEAGPKQLQIAAQDCSNEASGAFTGEVSAAMIAATGASAVIIGHSERRERWNESNALIAGKIARAEKAGLLPVLCIGESLEVREGGGTEPFLRDQLAFPATTLASLRRLVIAYEPIWAIGTGRNASGAICAAVKQTIVRLLKPVLLPACALSVVYGGSVTPENVDELVDEGDVDGFLVGGASLVSSRFIGIGRSLYRRAGSS